MTKQKCFLPKQRAAFNKEFAKVPQDWCQCFVESTERWQYVCGSVTACLKQHLSGHYYWTDSEEVFQLSKDCPKQTKKKNKSELVCSKQALDYTSLSRILQLSFNFFPSAHHWLRVVWHILFTGRVLLAFAALPDFNGAPSSQQSEPKPHSDRRAIASTVRALCGTNAWVKREREREHVIEVVEEHIYHNSTFLQQ